MSIIRHGVRKLPIMAHHGPLALHPHQRKDKPAVFSTPDEPCGIQFKPSNVHPTIQDSWSYFQEDIMATSCMIRSSSGPRKNVHYRIGSKIVCPL